MADSNDIWSKKSFDLPVTNFVLLSVSFNAQHYTSMEAYVSENVVEPINDFVKASIALVNRCNKPDTKGS